MRIAKSVQRIIQQNHFIEDQAKIIDHKHEPSRFLGDGVSFRAKLIGVLEVSEARGDRMCQDALADLKMAVRAAGEHKQRIVIHVAIDGLRLRDDKTGDSLYHHPVHKISFIAQDMTDSRAFGYIFGSPDTGHRFFGIKTDKTASQVVIAMRDLFQVVFELKKKEIELAKQQLEGKSSSESSGRRSLTSEYVKPKTVSDLSELTTSAGVSLGFGGGVAELVDLEQELSSLRRGLCQVEQLTPGSSDPFGDSFTHASARTSIGTQYALQKGLLPPPPTASVSRTTTRVSSASVAKTSPTAIKTSPTPVVNVAATITASSIAETIPITQENATSPAQASTSQPTSSLTFDVFTELDPLGTGKIKPYVDKKHFFQELKNPPKKVLKDLVNPQKSDSIQIQPAPPPPVNHYAVFTTDPFAESDPFEQDLFGDSFKSDPFNSTTFAFDEKKVSRESSVDARSDDSVRFDSRAMNGALNVALPPPELRSKKEFTSQQPPPPLPPKRESGQPPARPLPKDNPVDSAEHYLTPRPPPLPGGKRKMRLDLTLAALASCGLSELATKLDVPASLLTNMTLPQLTAYLKNYLDSTNDSTQEESVPSAEVPPEPVPVETNPIAINPPVTEPKFAAFEDNFSLSKKDDVFVADFEKFNEKAAPSYDRYAAFREIQDEEIKVIVTETESDVRSNQNVNGEESDSAKEEIDHIAMNKEVKNEKPVPSKSPMQVIDDLAFESFNLFKSASVSPRTTIDSKIEDIKMVMKNIQIKDTNQSGASPGDQMFDRQSEKSPNDRYAAFREISIIEPSQEEFESLPSDPPKERKKSEENTEFDNSDFFDCVDNSSLSYSHVDDAFRKSPLVTREDPIKEVVSLEKVEEVDGGRPGSARQNANAARLSTGSLSDIVSGSSPEINDRKETRGGGAWSPLAATSSDEPAAPRRNHRSHAHTHSSHTHSHVHHYRHKKTSSSSRDASPWEEEVVRPQRSQIRSSGSSHRESRHNSSGSRDFTELSGSRESRDRRASARRPKERSFEPREHWDRPRPRNRSPRERRESRRETSRRRPHLSWGDDEDFSDGGHSGGSGGDWSYNERDRWSSRSRRKDERNYNSLNWGESRRRMEAMRPPPDDDRRYGYSSSRSQRSSRRRSPSPPLRRKASGRAPSSEAVNVATDRTERLLRTDTRTEQPERERAEREPRTRDEATANLHKSDSVDIFSRKAVDPFAEDEFFCTSSDRVAAPRTDTWPHNFSAFDHA